MTNDVVLIFEKGNMRRFRRGLARFDPNAIDADNDGIVQEGTPFKRPAAPRRQRGENPRDGRQLQSRFWDYAKPQTPVDLDLPEDEDVDKPKPRNWRDIQLKPTAGQIPVDDVTHTISTDKVKRDQWFEFQDAVLERMMELRDDTSADKDTRRGIMKLYSSIKEAKPKVGPDGKLTVELSDMKRARILKGIQSMRKKKYDIPHMDEIFEMLEDAEKKSAFYNSGTNVSRQFSGVRYKNESLTHVSFVDELIVTKTRNQGFREKGESPITRIDVKALGSTISGRTRRTGRMITATFDPNAVDADGDQLVQDGTPFERPATPSLLGGQKPIPGRSLPEAVKKPGTKNSVMKAQADRKAMNFQIEKLRSTLRRVGNDYAPDWWDTKSEKEFEANISNASPEELAELFARIYVERRSLMTAKVGRYPDGRISVYADTPNDAAKKRNALLQRRGEKVYAEMTGRLIKPDADAKEIKKRGKQLGDWYDLAADNADWYFEQSFKITKRKRRKKLGIDAPVNRRGTVWAEDPDFPENSFEKITESIETDLLRANPSMSRDASRRRAEQIIREADKRMSRKPGKAPRAGQENRQIVNPSMSRRSNRRLAQLEARMEDGATLKSISIAPEVLSGSTPQVARRDSDEAIKQIKSIIDANKKKFGKLETRSDFAKAFKAIAPNADIDLLRSSGPLNNYDANILHAYLHAMQTNKDMMRFNIKIRKMDRDSVLNGIGGSHGFNFNPKGTGSDTFTHVFSYPAYDDVKDAEEQLMNQWMGAALASQLRGQPMPPYPTNDGAQGQIITDFLDKKLKSDMTEKELEDLYEEQLALGAFVTSLHEAGHGAHLAAFTVDKWGPTPDGKTILKQVDDAYKNMSPTEQKRAVRNTLFSEIDRAFSLAAVQAIKPFSDLNDAGFDADGLLNLLRQGVDPTDQRIVSGMNQAQKNIWAGILADERKNPGSLNARISLRIAYAQWSSAPVRDRSTNESLVDLIKFFKNEQSFKTFGLETYIDKFPLTSNGELDVKALMDPKNELFRIPNSSGGTSPFVFYDRYRQYTVKFLAHKEFQYDSLSDDDKELAEKALSKLSYYARTTRRYGPEFGKTHVEGLAELNALQTINAIQGRGFSRGSDLLSSFREVNFTAEELRVMDALFQWLQR